MNDGETEEREHGVELEYDIDEPPQKVWRAISIAEFREHWLPKDALADPEAASVTPGQEVRYRLRDNAPPYLESMVTFQIAPNAAGGTRLRILHELADTRFQETKAAVNDNGPLLMLAA